MRLSLLSLALLAAAPAWADPPAVAHPEGLVDLTVAATPVSAVLDRLARQTGMKVVYEGPQPHMLVSVSITRATPAQAVFRVLEGLGVGYATRLDPTGTKVETLLLVASGASPARPTAPSPAQSPMMRPFEQKAPPPDDEPLEDAESADEAHEVAPPEAQPVPAPGLLVPPPVLNPFPSSPFAPTPSPPPAPVPPYDPQRPPKSPEDGASRS